tara:strand:- start:2948 stop:4498 length:1551 start_codon:yes stop_codon:yes gene_type:complete
MKSLKHNQSQLPGWVTLKRLLIPSFAFCFFLVFLLSHREIADNFLGNVSDVFLISLNYGSQIGMWLSATFLVQRLVTVFVWDGLIAGISGRPVPRLPKDVTAMILFGVATMGVLATVFNQSVTGIWATSGVFGIVVGIALRNVILDVFIGLSMHVEQPFRIGDWVMIHQNRRETHIIGQVIEINWRTTRLKTTKKNMVVIPNSKMGEAILTNYMQPKPHFRIDLDFVLDYSIPPNRAIRVLTAGIHALVDNEKILEDPAPEVRLDKTMMDGQGYEVRYFILPVNLSPNESRHLVNKSILEHLALAGLAPAMPKERVFMETSGKLPLLNLHEKVNYEEMITKNELFSILSEEEIREVRVGERRLKLEAGETLYEQGDSGDTLYLVVEGLLQSFCSFSGEEAEKKIEVVQAGRHIGEDCVMGRKERSSTIRATSEVVVMAYEGVRIRKIAKKNGKFLARLNQNLNFSKDQIERSKWRAEKKNKTPLDKRRKKGVAKTLQTFFSDLFPDSSSPSTESQL